MSWSWKTKPRSIIKTIRWFPYFAELEGENWDLVSTDISKCDNSSVHPIRRMYIHSAHRDEDSFLSSVSLNMYLTGQKDEKETEANGRMDKGAYEFFGFGYVKPNGIIAVTEVGNKIVQGTFDSEDYLKQLLKLRLPNHAYQASRMKAGKFIFPMELILKAFAEYESLNRSELALLFGCDDTSEIPKTLKAIGRFKDEYSLLKNKNDTAGVKEIFLRIYQETYGDTKNKAETFYDYAEALSRTLLYTGLFTSSGRSIATKIRVAQHSETKVKILREKYSFTCPEHASLDEYMLWFGSTHNVKLPWENPEERKLIIKEKAAFLASKIEEADEAYIEKARISPEDIQQLLTEVTETSDVNSLKEVENRLSDAITSHNEEYFIKVLSKTKEEREAILDKFEDILANEDMSALWLEVNTWKSLIAIDGEQIVKRNFKIEDDLSPKSFAPGVGNTPDMELYQKDYIIVPEVSLMTGVRQWEHEGSSVIDHVLSFIEEYKEKKVLGLFISSRINLRTVWQFFVLNRESWMGAPVPVVPFTIKQYMNIIEFIYENDCTIDDFRELLERVARSCAICKNYKVWEQSIGECICGWKAEKSLCSL